MGNRKKRRGEAKPDLTAGRSLVRRILLDRAPAEDDQLILAPLAGSDALATFNEWMDGELAKMVCRFGGQESVSTGHAETDEAAPIGE